MRAVEIRQPGGPDVLQMTARPVPEIAADEVLVRVAAAGVNRPDVAQRSGVYPPPPGASDIPGLEIAGRIEQVGAAVSGWKAGDEVCALVTGGGYAEFCAAPARQCLPVPRGLSLIEAASLPETFFTVWSNVFDRGRLAAGETLLVQGGSSGIGVAAIQMAKALGSRVIATAGSDDKCRACEDLGADVAVNYKTQDFVEAVKRSTDGKGADVILDMVGGDYVRREIACVALEGRIVLIAFLGGAQATFDIMPLMLKRATITGSTLRTRPVAFKAAIAAALRERVWPLIETGRIKPAVHRVFTLGEAARAHALMETSAHIGKIVLAVPEAGAA
ncbi:MAG: NAD(P)H-quinone oxidoreductase [Xanthobacteraceae bacterium]|nr:NAD(P)H-quinone oxidoreductase [Xanthobacteraceae bacterium]